MPPPPATGPPAPPVAVATKPAPAFAGVVPSVSISLVSVTSAVFLGSSLLLGRRLDDKTGQLGRLLGSDLLGKGGSGRSHDDNHRRTQQLQPA